MFLLKDLLVIKYIYFVLLFFIPLGFFLLLVGGWFFIKEHSIFVLPVLLINFLISLVLYKIFKDVSIAVLFICWFPIAGIYSQYCLINEYEVPLVVLLYASIPCSLWYSLGIIAYNKYEQNRREIIGDRGGFDANDN